MKRRKGKKKPEKKYGTSEEELGPVLGQYDRDSLIIQTKVVPGGTVKEFLDTLDTSMNCVRVDRLDLLDPLPNAGRVAAYFPAAEKEVAKPDTTEVNPKNWESTRFGRLSFI